MLADYVIDRLYPGARDTAQPYRALLDVVISRTAALVARWQLVGFIHGVMNTDNMAISGETIDYGPCAFMDTFHPATVFSSIDSGGRYAYGNQPRIAHWNLVRLAQSLLSLLGGDEDAALASAREAINAYPPAFESAIFTGLRRKLGLLEERDGDIELAGELLEKMAANKVDYTLFFRRLCDSVELGPEADVPVRALFEDPDVVRRLGLEVAPASGSGECSAIRTCFRHARREPGLHSTQSSGRSGNLSSTRTRGLRTLRRTADGSRRTL